MFLGSFAESIRSSCHSLSVRIFGRITTLTMHWVVKVVITNLFSSVYVFIVHFELLFFNERLNWFIGFNENLQISLGIDDLWTFMQIFSIFFDKHAKLQNGGWKFFHFFLDKVSIILVALLNFVQYTYVVLLKEHNCLVVILQYTFIMLRSLKSMLLDFSYWIIRIAQRRWPEQLVRYMARCT